MKLLDKLQLIVGKEVSFWSESEISIKIKLKLTRNYIKAVSIML